jgi:hypothetical protein
MNARTPRSPDSTVQHSDLGCDADGRATGCRLSPVRSPSPPLGEAGVNLSVDPQTGLGGRGADQRLTPPILNDGGEQPVLDLISLAGAQRQMGHRDQQTGLIGVALQFVLPELDPGTVAGETGKNVGTAAFSACSDSTRRYLLRICHRRPRFPI